MKIIRGEIGNSMRFVDLELTGDAKVDVGRAVEEEHYEHNSSCDICVALENGFPFSAAHLLRGATETPLLNQVVKHYHEEFYGKEGTGWPVDWDKWVDWYGWNTWNCKYCNSYTVNGCDICWNCGKGKPAEDDEDNG